MKRKEFLLQLIGELSNYLLEGMPRRVVLSVHQEADGIHISAMDDTPHSDQEVEVITHALQGEKRPELSGYYGHMIGHDLFSPARLELLGLQVKHGEVNRSENGIRIDILLGGEQFDSSNFELP